MNRIMMHDFRRIDEVFSRVCVLPKSEHETALREYCGTDYDLASEVKRLLDIDASLPAFAQEQHIVSGLQRRAAAVWQDGASPTYIPKQIGHFEIVGILGCGGMGTVYRAKQQHPRREVALKVLRHGMMTPKLVRRFDFEIDILAKLQHSNIAQLFEAGTFDDGGGPRPYFAMELIDGTSLLSFANARGLNGAQRLGLFVQICRAVEHAHQKGVVHRDLKPANIFITKDGDVKVLDFGIARSTNGDVHVTTMSTGIGDLMGTLAYMSPEQAAGNCEDIDTRSDVYSLGVILYELLSGKLPHDLRGKSIPSAARTIEEGTPLPLRTHQARFVGDLDTIVAKAMNKEPERRYSSAAALADDIDRHVRDEPISARPPTTWEQWRRFCRRNRALAASVLLAFVVLAGATAFSSWMAWREHRANVAAIANAQIAQKYSSRAVRTKQLMTDMFSSSNGHATVKVEELQRQVAEARRQPQGTSRRLAIALTMYSAALQEQGEYTRAESAIREAVELFSRLDAPRLPAALAQLASLLVEQGRGKEALQTIDQACSEAARLLPETWDKADIYCLKSSIEADNGLLNEARESAKLALNIMQRTVEPDHARMVRPLLAMGNVELRENKPELAVPLLKDALKIVSIAYKPTSDVRIRVEDALMDALVQAGHHDEARAHIRTLVVARTVALGESDSARRQDPK